LRQFRSKLVRELAARRLGRRGQISIARIVVIAIATIVVGSLLAPSLAAADPNSLYQGAAPRPGPDILYEPLANAPQLQNAGNWNAAPLLVSGATAYRSGEFLYQDWLFDDSGARGTQVANDPRTNHDAFSRWNGTYVYPTNTAIYGNNAADLVELRVEPASTDTAFRLTLNTIKDSSVVGATIAIGGTAGTLRAWPYSANVRSPAQYFLTVHGTSIPGAVAADLRDAATGLVVSGTAPTATLDMTRRQITVTVPHSTWNPGTSVVRLAAGVGLWNASTSLYRVPAQNPSATLPGGAQLLGSPPALFNLAFRRECQMEDPLPPLSAPAGCEPQPNVQSPNALSDASWWRDKAQAHVLGSGTALATPDISQFFASVDFSKLASNVTDESGTPQTGAMNRIMASHFELEQGVNYSQDCNTSAATSTNGCLGWFRGQLQPYAIYVPTQPQPAGGYGLTLLLHSLDANYNQFLASKNQSQFGERSPGSIVITAAGRGPDGWYYGYAGSDTFEMWADTAARFTLDPEWSVISGYSMGGYATFKLGSQFPDLFAKAQPVVGPPGDGIWVPPSPPQPGGDKSNTNRQLGSFRNVPLLIWNGDVDELVPVAGAQQQAATFGTLGYRYEWDLYNTADHFALALNDEYGPAASFLGTTQVDRNPPHVTHVYNPTMDFATGQLNADHAYWLSGITLRNAGGSAPLGTIDVRSEGFGVGDPTPSGVSTGAGVLMGGQVPMAYTSQTQTWGPAPTTPTRDRLNISANNVSDVTVNARRARVTCNAEKNITSDTGSPPPVVVHMVDCPAVPTLSIANVNQVEGDSGTNNLIFTATLTGNTDNLPVSFHYQTADGSASSLSDYGAVSGNLSFGPGETTKAISVPINGDETAEGNETFTVQISDVQFATPATASATGTILNDDALGYARPISATPAAIRLVPAFDPCAGSNATHAAPLALPSCDPPVQASDYLTLGSPDVTGTPAQGNGTVTLTVLGETPINPNNGDQADVGLSLRFTDVRKQSDFSPYGGELRAVLDLRITDRYNGASLGEPATASDSPLAFNIPCSAGTCNVTTTADAVTTDFVREGKRAVWQLGQVRIYDGGADGDADTLGDNTLFAVQGLFAP
jgi:hypothetical protein